MYSNNLRNIFNINYYPCLCLCRGLTQITRITLILLIILQFQQIFFTDARTFIDPPKNYKDPVYALACDGVGTKL